ncbi:hypothetical protein TpMuguga_04g00839 [Theileria parva strain Muguga]|uniref:Uncharacterized protein n=1 Tax=Theileria parva TaxID=5875 RepID=Q4N1A7_THEPA|nr:uncharacterized protein TpMuguga_04g00839 [Theileria parva strain Muguga]EAN32193.1 hypothetical protein TpMuguga_04g00839 [Theileria parva strain Muguga]|eukprot:XP_764476.1 hypothetical protein [Theileria parva strain Muguga]
MPKMKIIDEISNYKCFIACNNFKYVSKILEYFEKLYKSNIVHYRIIINKLKKTLCDLSDKKRFILSIVDYQRESNEFMEEKDVNLKEKNNKIMEQVMRIEGLNRKYEERIIIYGNEKHNIVNQIIKIESSMDFNKNQILYMNFIVHTFGNKVTPIKIN